VRRVILFLAIVWGLAEISTPALLQAQTTTIDLERIQRATVFIMQAQNIGSDLIVNCVGSGTIVSRDGLILTNAHNTVQGPGCQGETLVIAFNIRLDEPPVPKYRAEIIQSSTGLDLALLRITQQLDGRLIEPGSLALPFVELGDSSQVNLDDTITAVGFPGIGNDTISTGVQRGTVVGFVAEPSGGAKSWIKTSISIPGTMSGAGAYDEESRLIGIPTTAPVTVQTIGSTCQPIQDTNRDGLVDTRDVCIPISSTINALRPSNFARPLLLAASLGLQVETLNAGNFQAGSTGSPTFRRIFFSPAVNEAGLPTTVIRSLPAGSNSLYLFFDYENMRPDTVYELRVTTDGIPNSTFSLAPVRWSGGERGLWYIGSSGQPWPNGIYEFTLLADGAAADTARLVIGGAPENTPVMSDLVFGVLDQRGNVLGNGYVLAASNIANARFIYRNMQDGVEWTAVWYFNGAEVRRDTNTWSDGPEGTKTIGIEDPNGLLPGTYRLEVYVEGRLAVTSDFIIAGAQQGAFPEIFTDAHFTSADSPEEARTAAPISSFANTIDALYAMFDWQRIAPGTLWTLRWSVDENILFEQTTPWSTAENGENFLMRLSGTSGVPDGTYRVDLLVNGILMGTTEAQVGIGQLPIDRFANASGVQLRGQILDADTNQGVPGVTFVVISEDFSVEDFVWNEAQIYAMAVTDRNGRFQLDRPLELSIGEATVPYSVLIAADGYLPITADGFLVTPETENPLDLTIYLTRD
jgi:S1-C subfamily serine protease